MSTEQPKIDIHQQQAQLDAGIKDNMKRIKHKLIVMSGKGGVGKSTISTNLAYGLMMKGFTVGLMDTDIHGPSLGKMLGIEGKYVQTNAQGKLIPVNINGIKVISMASIMQDSDAPVIWRGPLKMGAIKQFLGDLEWGDLDFLVIDSPPGTGDEPLSVCQLIPEADGSIIVTTPQDVALIDSRKTVRFSQALKIPVLGIIENMSGFNCPHCNKPIDLFKTGGGEKAAKNMSIPFLGRIPIEPEIVESSDNGSAYIFHKQKTETGKAIQEIVANITENIS